MATNIEIAAELNKLLQEQVKIIDEQNKSLKEQVKLSEAVIDSFSKMKNIKSSEPINALNNSINQTKKSSDEFTGSFSQGLNQIAKRTFLADKTTKNFMGRLDKLVKYPVKLLAFEQGMVGFATGMQLANSALGSMLDITGSVITSLGQLAISIVTLPFKMLNVLMAEAASISGTELMQAIENVRKQFGDLSKNEAHAVMKSFRSMRGELSNTGLSVRRVLGNMAERLTFLRETAEQFGRSFNKFQNEFMNYGEEIAAYVKGLGITGEQIKGIADFANAAGKNITEVGREITSMAYGVGEAFNINGKLVSRDISEMMKDFKNFGSLGVKQMTQISVFTHKLGVEIKDLLGIIDKFDNFETAAESAAQLSQAFGLQLDTLDLLFDQDPASRFEKLRKSFLATGKSVETLSRQELALLTSQTGLTENALKIGFAQSSLGMSYKDVQKQTSLTEKKQLSQAEAMEKLSNSIERMVKEGEQMKGGFFDIFLQGFFRGIKWTNEWRQMLLNLRKAMRQIYLAGTEVGRMFVKTFPGIKDVFTGIADMFKKEKWVNLKNGLVGVFKSFFTDLTGDNPKSLGNLFERLQKLFFNFFDQNTPEGKKTVGGFKKIFKTIVLLTADFAKMAMEGLTQAITSFTDFIISPQKFLAKASSSSSGFSKYVIELLTPVWKAIESQWPKLEKALTRLLDVAWNKTMDFAKKHWTVGLKALAIYMAPAIIASFTRALGVSVAAAVSKGLIQVALPNIAGAVKQFFGGFGSMMAKESELAGSAMKTVAQTVSQVGMAEQATKKLNKGDIIKFGVKLLAIGAALAVGTVAFVYGLVKVAQILKDNGLDTIQKIAAPLTVLGSAITGVVALGLTSKLLSTVPWQQMAKTLAVGAIGIGALGGLSVAMAWFFTKTNDVLKGITASQAKTSIGILVGMTGSLALLAGVLVGAGAILLTPGLNVMALAGIAGLAALGLISLGVAKHSKSIIQEIDKYKLSADFGTKLKAFTSVTSTITQFAKVFVDLMSEAKPSFFSLKGLFGTGGGEAINEALGPLNKIISVISENAKNIFKTVTNTLSAIPSTINPETVAAFTNLLSSVIELASKFSSGNLSSSLSKLSDNSANANGIAKLSDSLTKYVLGVSKSVLVLIPTLKDTFNQIGSLQIDEKGLGKIDSFIQFVGAFAQLTQILNPETFRVKQPNEQMLNFLIDMRTSFLDIGRYADAIKDDFDNKVSRSIKDMIQLITDVSDDLTQLSKLKSIPALNIQLKHAADNLSLQGTKEIKMKLDDINLHINVEVKLSVDEIEKSLLEKTNAKILSRK